MKVMIKTMSSPGSKVAFFLWGGGGNGHQWANKRRLLDWWKLPYYMDLYGSTLSQDLSTCQLPSPSPWSVRAAGSVHTIHWSARVSDETTWPPELENWTIFPQDGKLGEIPLLKPANRTCKILMVGRDRPIFMGYVSFRDRKSFVIDGIILSQLVMIALGSNTSIQICGWDFIKNWNMFNAFMR